MKRFAIVLIAAVVASPVVKAENNGALGRKVEDFKLQDYRGAEHALSEITGKQATVIAFLGTECPLAKLYGPRLAELAQKYAPHGVAFVGIDANRQDSLSEISAYARTAGIIFPMLKDTGNSVADAMGATRHPRSLRARQGSSRPLLGAHRRSLRSRHRSCDGDARLSRHDARRTVGRQGCRDSPHRFGGLPDWPRARSNRGQQRNVLETGRADLAGALRELPSGGRNRAVCNDRL